MLVDSLETKKKKSFIKNHEGIRKRVEMLDLEVCFFSLKQVLILERLRRQTIPVSQRKNLRKTLLSIYSTPPRMRFSLFAVSHTFLSRHSACCHVCSPDEGIRSYSGSSVVRRPGACTACATSPPLTDRS